MKLLKESFQFFFKSRTAPVPFVPSIDKNMVLAAIKISEDYDCSYDKVLAILRLHVLRFEMNRATVDDLRDTMHHWYRDILEEKK